MNQKGGANFKTINEAIKSIPTGNKNRVIIKLAPGVYNEKVTIDVARPFVTLLGQPGSETILTYHGTAAQYGTVESATLIVWSDYFLAANLIIKVCEIYIRSTYVIALLTIYTDLMYVYI